MTRALIVAALLTALVGCSSDTRFHTCDEAHQAGVPLPLTPDSPGWNPKLDRDKNGQAC